jgi:hypothetical protein
MVGHGFEDQVRLVANISVEVLQTQFGAQCEPCIRVSDARPIVDGARRCEAEIELQHAPDVATTLVAIVIERYRRSRAATAYDLQVTAITDDGRHLKWRTLAALADSADAPTVEEQLNQSILANIDLLMLEPGRDNVREASAIYDNINAMGITASRNMVPQLVNQLRDRFRARAAAAIVQSSTEMRVTDALGRFYFFCQARDCPTTQRDAATVRVHGSL